jgi:hypothetical protein
VSEPSPIGQVETPRRRHRRTSDRPVFERPCRPLGKDWRWTWAIVRGSALLPHGAKLVYQIHVELDRPGPGNPGGCWLTEEALAQQIGAARGHAGRLRRLLVEVGLLKQVTIGRRSRWFPTLPPGVQNVGLDLNAATNGQRTDWIQAAVGRLDAVLVAVLGEASDGGACREIRGTVPRNSRHGAAQEGGLMPRPGHYEGAQVVVGTHQSFVTPTPEHYTQLDTKRDTLGVSPLRGSPPSPDTGSHDPREEQVTRAPEAPGGGPAVAVLGGHPAPPASEGSPGTAAPSRVEGERSPADRFRAMTLQAKALAAEIEKKERVS